MKNKYLRFSVATLLLLSSPIIAQENAPIGVTLASGPTLLFSNATGFIDNIAQDGDGGSVTITDLDLQIYPIDKTGKKLTTDTLQYHDGKDANWPDYPAIITYGDVNSFYGWTIKSADGSSFSLDSLSFLDWGNYDGATFAITAFENSISKGTVTFKGNTTGDFVRLNNTGLLTSAFKSVDEVRLYQLDGKDSYISLNNIKVSSSVVTALNDDLSLKNINIYPNPTEGSLSVTLKSDAKVTVTNALGKVIFDELLTAGNPTIDLSKEANGVYVLSVHTEQETQMVKFVKK